MSFRAPGSAGKPKKPNIMLRYMRKDAWKGKKAKIGVALSVAATASVFLWALLVRGC